MIRSYIICLCLAAAMLPAAAQSAATLTLDAAKAVGMALASDEEVKIADNSAAQARLRQQVARTAYLPDFKGNATTGWMLPDTKYEEMALTLRMRGVYMAGISMTQPIFAGGKIVAANRMAAIGREVAAEQRRMTRDQVAADAETSYWTYVAVRAKVDMVKSYMALLDTALMQTNAALRAGMATENDILRIESRRSQTQYQLESVLAGENLCRMALCTSIGVDTATDLIPADAEIPVDIPGNLYDYDLEARPEARILDGNIRIKQQQVRSTRADYLPVLGFQAGWSAYGNIKMNTIAQTPDGGYMPVSSNISNTGFSFLFSLQVPIFHWGEGVKKVKEQRLEVENARLERDNTMKKLDLQVKQAISNLETGRTMLVSAMKAMDVADASLKSETQRYDVGLSNLTDLLDAQSQWQNARASLIEAQTQLRIYTIDYRLATSTL